MATDPTGMMSWQAGLAIGLGVLAVVGSLVATVLTCGATAALTVGATTMLVTSIGAGAAMGAGAASITYAAQHQDENVYESKGFWVNVGVSTGFGAIGGAAGGAAASAAARVGSIAAQRAVAAADVGGNLALGALEGYVSNGANNAIEGRNFNEGAGMAVGMGLAGVGAGLAVGAGIRAVGVGLRAARRGRGQGGGAAAGAVVPGPITQSRNIHADGRTFKATNLATDINPLEVLDGAREAGFAMLSDENLVRVEIQGRFFYANTIMVHGTDNIYRFSRVSGGPQVFTIDHIIENIVHEPPISGNIKLVICGGGSKGKFSAAQEIADRTGFNVFAHPGDVGAFDVNGFTLFKPRSRSSSMTLNPLFGPRILPE